jgi:hypothetical protein
VNPKNLSTAFLFLGLGQFFISLIYPGPMYIPLGSTTLPRNWKVVLAFLDDILVLGKDFEGHLANLRAVLVRFREYGLKLKPKKCELFQKEVEFLGRVVEPRGKPLSTRSMTLV